MFIRAPIVDRVGPDVDVLARLDDGRIVAVRERNVLATAFHPELAGETRFHRLVATMAAEHDDPGEGSGRRPHPTRRGGQARTDERPVRQGPGRAPDRPGRARRAVAAVPAGVGRDALARPARERPPDRRVQPVPAAARRLPAARPAVRLRGGGRAVGPDPGRARDGPRRVDDRRARRDRPRRGRRHPLPARPAHPARRGEARRDPVPRRLRRRRRQRRAVHAGRLRPVRRGGPAVPAARRGAAGAWSDERAAEAGIRPARADRLRRPRPPLRDRDARSPSSASRPIGSATGSARAPSWRVPRSSLAPILRFADVEAFVQDAPDGGTGRDPARRASSRSGWPRRISRTTSRSWPGPKRTPRRWWSTVSG